MTIYGLTYTVYDYTAMRDLTVSMAFQTASERHSYIENDVKCNKHHEYKSHDCWENTWAMLEDDKYREGWNDAMRSVENNLLYIPKIRRL